MGKILIILVICLISPDLAGGQYNERSEWLLTGGSALGVEDHHDMMCLEGTTSYV